MNKIVGITIGDIRGIGIQILLETWKKKGIKKFILFTDEKVLNNYFKINNLKIKVNKIDIDNKNLNYNKYKLNIFSYKSSSLEDNTYKSMKYAYNFYKAKHCIGIITLPLRKDLIKLKIDKNFIGQTEFFQKMDKKKYSNMILYHKKIIISPLTTHIELKKVSKKISNREFLINQIFNLNKTLKTDFKINKPKILLSGINPHAGENGEIGKEEIKYLYPVVNQLIKKGIDIKGPVSADSMLLESQIKKYNCFIFLYHDQALIPFKYISQFSGVNYTGNLSIIRTSPDHGTAYNLVGEKNISNKSFINCYKLVEKIYKNRMTND